MSVIRKHGKKFQVLIRRKDSPHIIKSFVSKEAKRINFENKQNALKKISTKNYGGFISNQQLNRDKFNPTNKGKNPKKKTYY